MDSEEKVKRMTNPREQANIFSLISFIYTRSIFARGFKKDLEDDDLYEIVKSCQSKKCGDKLESKYKQNGKSTSTIRIIWSVYGIRYMSLGALHLLWKLVNSVMEPEAISRLVAYFKPGQIEMSLNDALFYAAIMIGLKLLHSFYFQNYFIYLNQLAIQIRTSLSSVIYRKALKLSPKALTKISLGNIVTVVTKDLLQFEDAVWYFNDLWIAIIQTIVLCYLIYRKVGLASLVGIGVLFSYTPIQVFIGSLIKNMRLKINKRTDERLQITQETLSTIKIIKMYTWELIFGEKINESRRKEVKALMKNLISKTTLMATSVLVSKVGFYALIMASIWFQSDLSAETLFYVLRCFTTLRFASAFSLSLGFSAVAELVASLKRIDTILKEEELPDDSNQQLVPVENPEIEFKQVSLSLGDKNVLKNINIKFSSGLNIVTGQLGCGKSSLIKVVLKDYPVEQGNFIVKGRCSYASQDPWLFPASIKQNIIFGERYDYQRYQKVIEVCALQYDFEILENGDETIVADRGLNLSKGQQGRVNLARAVYKDADIYLIDDALTALDTRVQEQIFNYCIKDFLKDKLIILVTHNPGHIEKADKVIILDDGVVKFEGKQEELSKDLLATIEEDVQEEKLQKVEKELPNVEEDETSKLIQTTQKKKKGIYSEDKKKGGITMATYIKYFKSAGGFLFFFCIILMYFGATFTENASLKILTNWIHQHQNLINFKHQYMTNTSSINPLELTGKPKANISLENDNSTIQDHYNILENESLKVLNIYSILIVGSAVLEILKHALILKFVLNASINIHKKMINSIVFSVMSFFDKFLIGNILNRFSQDLNVLDEFFPFILGSLISTAFSIAGLIGLIATIDWKFMIPSLVLITSLVILRFIYIPTARSLKRLEAATRSPIVGHLNSTLEGMTTIRAFKAQPILTNEFDKHQDLYTSAYYTSLCIKRAFAFYMDFFSVIFIAFIVLRFLFVEAYTSAENIGLTLTQVTAMAMVVQSALVLWSEVENYMTSVERALEYTELEPEKTSGQQIENWPTKGNLEYKNVTMSYTNSNEKVLKGISFSVASTEKIGIVGRTGAGKSSIILTLFRLYDYGGQILVDDTDIKTISLKFLREHISIIPQDPVMFSGTIRSNIDPFKKCSDDDIWKTLHKVQMGSIIPNLDTLIKDINFSTGQRQLISVARAIIKNSKIVVLDEATANMDPETEALIQNIIQENFSNCTILIIAHRLQSILNCNKILVLEKGEIVEFDTPLILINNKNSKFSQMLKNAGIENSVQSER